MLKLPLVCLALLGTCLPGIGRAQSDHPLVELQGTTRVLMVFAPDSTSANYKKQLALIAHHNYELTERNTVVIPIASGSKSTDDHFIGENLPLSTAADQAVARTRFHVQPGDFLVVLLNRDGTEQIRSVTPVTFQDLVASLGPAPGIFLSPTPAAMETLALDRTVQLVPTAEPTPLDEIVAALRKVESLDGLSDSEFLWLAEHGIERKIGPGNLLFLEGDTPLSMTIMLAGEVHIRRAQTGSVSYFIARMGQISGILPFSRMKGYGGSGYSVGALWSIDIPREMFPEMLAAIPSMGQRCVTVLLNRVREITRVELQAEKLTALGKLAANLAHELNNPASAAQRSAASLFGELRQYGDQKYRLGRLALSAEQTAAYKAWVTRAHTVMADYASLNHDDENPLAATDREDEITRWLEAHRVPEPWCTAPSLAETRLPISMLDELADVLPPEILAVAVATVATSLRVERLAETVVNSTIRIFDFISAIKDYSYMDQAPIQEVDVAQQLDTTLTMFSSRLDRVTIERNFDPDLPLISAYGSELNQVWTELIQNAIEALALDSADGKARGILRLTTRPLGQMVVIELWNSGPGIPATILTRIFEPFFTTKAPGTGIGLGLDAVTRIVSKHGGIVTVESKAGATCFQVRLPIERAGTY